MNFTNTPIAEARRDGGPIVRVVGPPGTDLANHSGYPPFTISPDGGFHVPTDVANVLTAGVAGFVRRELTANELLRGVARAVQALPDGHRYKQALNQALADLCSDAPEHDVPQDVAPTPPQLSTPTPSAPTA